MNRITRIVGLIALVGLVGGFLFYFFGGGNEETPTEFEGQPQAETFAEQQAPDPQPSPYSGNSYQTFGWIPLEPDLVLDGNQYRRFIACGPSYWDSVIILKSQHSDLIVLLEGVEVQQFLHLLDSMGSDRPCPGGRG